jgi:hypothetical protein
MFIKEPFDWNKIDGEVRNGVDGHETLESIGNMYMIKVNMLASMSMVTI